MSSVSIQESGQTLATDVLWARSPLSRLKGLLGRPPLIPGQGIVIEPAGQVHTFGMTYAIDVVFCERSGAVLHIVGEMRPWRVTRWVRGARYAIELPAGTVPSTLERGVLLSIDLSEGSRPNR